MNYITGEKIQNETDLFISTPDNFNFNPSINFIIPFKLIFH